MFQSITALGVSIAKLVLFLIIGFIIFKVKFLKHHIFPIFFKILLNILFPLFFIHNFPLGWNKALETGWHWMVIFFVACTLMMIFQMIIGNFIILKKKLIPSDHPESLFLLFSVHNAGYIPLPVLASILDPSFMVYMFFYVMAFNIIFWTYVAGKFKKKKADNKTTFLNPPLLGLITGIILSIINMFYPFYNELPSVYLKFMDNFTSLILDLILILLGGILASIPVKQLVIKKEFIWVGIIKLILYPLVFLGILLFLPLESLPKIMRLGIPLGLIIEAATPPATNIMIIAKAFGKDSDVSYLGSGVLVTYTMSFISLPLFLITTLLVFQ